MNLPQEPDTSYTVSIVFIILRKSQLIPTPLVIERNPQPTQGLITRN